ncbi:MAG TPA: zinc dependent phospholipase C family protein [Bryobacteraceae bacterium]|nr:zinc dependent phospholipase C family protein [Bryobacteraceae bacterium]
MRRLLLCAAALLIAPAANAYSVLTHEAIIDSAWETNLKPMLVKRFPQASPEDLRHAHGYAYAGAIIQDMGYYPFGSQFFSDLTHYVRSGDFVMNMLAEAQDLNEYAFALGALAHYAADTTGHPFAVNLAVATQYPKLEAKYGRTVTYADNPGSHLKVEFGFDVWEVAKGNYAPQSYHDFIGFEVSKPVLERAFHDTYSLDLPSLFTSFDLALGTYRHSVSTLIPEMTKVAWDMKKDDLKKAHPGLTRRQFRYNLSRAAYRKEWDRDYRKPGFLAQILGFFFRIIPKVGPFRAAAFKPPTSTTITLFEDSFNRTLTEYRGLLAQVEEGSLALPNRDFDTGQPTRPGEYKLADHAYSQLAIELAGKDPKEVDAMVVKEVLDFYQDLNQPYATKSDPREWQDTIKALTRLRTEPADPSPDPALDK